MQPYARARMRHSALLEVRQVRNGRGLVARTAFRAGARICVIDGEIVSSARVWEYWDRDPRRAENCFRFDAERYLDPRGCLGEFANHSCQPNAAVRIQRGKLCLVATRSIARGDEVTHDYSTLLGADDVWTLTCNCGEKECRGIVASIDTLPATTLRDYLRLRFVPAHIVASMRCSWCGTDPLYVKYHDTEWGIPVTDDRALFAKLTLDGFQAGLSWITILRKRTAFERAFHNFDPARVARYGSRDRMRLLKDASIVRSTQKIDAAIRNARAWVAVMEHGGRGAFRDLLWESVGHTTRVNHWRRSGQVPAATRQSEAMSRTLRSAGFSFCGPTICYAFMQAVGMVNDHLVCCPRHGACERRARLR